MMNLGGGWLFVIIDIVAVAVLGAAMFYGSRIASRAPRDPATRRAAEEATRRLYHPRERDLYRHRDRDTGRPAA